MGTNQKEDENKNLRRILSVVLAFFVFFWIFKKVKLYFLVFWRVRCFDVVLWKRSVQNLNLKRLYENFVVFGTSNAIKKLRLPLDENYSNANLKYNYLSSSAIFWLLIHIVNANEMLRCDSIPLSLSSFIHRKTKAKVVSQRKESYRYQLMTQPQTCANWISNWIILRLTQV